MKLDRFNTVSVAVGGGLGTRVGAGYLLQEEIEVGVYLLALLTLEIGGGGWVGGLGLGLGLGEGLGVLAKEVGFRFVESVVQECVDFVGGFGVCFGCGALCS